MNEQERPFRSREEADAYLLGEVAKRGCAMMQIDQVPGDLRDSLAVGRTLPSWRVDVKDLCTILLYAPDPTQSGISLKPGEYIYQFYFGGSQTTQDRGTAREILSAVDANLMNDSERKEARLKLSALIEKLQGSAREIPEFPKDLHLAPNDFAYVSGAKRFSDTHVIRVDFPDRVVALLRRPERRFFAGDFFLNGKFQGTNHDWSVSDVEHNVKALMEQARKEREKSGE